MRRRLEIRVTQQDGSIAQSAWIEIGDDERRSPVDIAIRFLKSVGATVRGEDLVGHARGPSSPGERPSTPGSHLREELRSYHPEGFTDREIHEICTRLAEETRVATSVA